MALVDYSDSDASEAEEQPIANSAAPLSKSGFRKVVDRSNPGKITVSLPQSTTTRDSAHEDAPQAKRVKTSGGAFSGFNSFLPAPKRTAPPTATLGGGATRGGLGAGVNLKTGATPAFNRESEARREPDGAAQSMYSSQNSANSSLPSAETQDSLVQIPADEVKLVGKPLMFRPLSVANKSKKKKPTSVVSIAKTSISQTIANPPPETPAPRAKVSLFSIGTDSEKLPISTSSGDYTPMMIQEVVEGQDDDESLEQSSLTPSYEDYTPNTSFSSHLPPVPTPPVSQSLDDIAGDLNLSAAEKRQLFGRQKGSRGQAATKIINFNTDQEYLHNEQLRAAGEQVSHNPVRAIAPGKHSLKQLVNAAQSQKEALEESFAKGKNNRAEASSRYGW